MSEDCLTRMETEATKESLRFLTGKNLDSEVPFEQYYLQSHGL